MTYRERRLARAERLRGWAEKRQTAADATLGAINDRYRGDIAFNTQPGHIPERARVIAAEDRAFASLDKAGRMASRADSIEAQADRAIYSDDPDAADRLRERIAALENQRAGYAAANAAYRKTHRAELAAMTPYERSQAVPRQAYELSNLGGQISKARERLHAIEHPAPTWFHASRREPTVCYKCDRPQSAHTPHPKAPTILMCEPLAE